MAMIKCVTVAAAVLACASWANAQVIVPAPYTDGSGGTDGFGGWYRAAVPGPYGSVLIPGLTNPKPDESWTDPEQPGALGGSWRYPSVQLFTR
jgi:hypothetical protein